VPMGGSSSRMTQISNTEGVAPPPDDSLCETYPNNETRTQRRSAAGKWAMPEEGPPIDPKGAASRGRARQRLSLPEFFNSVNFVNSVQNLLWGDTLRTLRFFP
jgi:hypothetical protein